ncbi:hypothetical protein HG536_0H01990 [Torulaspora globosa]|uniref:Meiotic sister-chromatid recombination protein 3 n=1 Tax=Torulaspora globosa TaxID=48254 RepID=A0A7G3ZMT8_9SACH|nr:uncharacterized protein HG536_0H01990 [Torulaspora globosa]QLL34824.1 hypothetical protein HG536_0H01990 [Torulaspora globosa]
MVFGMNKRERRVPDLSRYDYHYQNKDDFNRSSRLSAAAAHAASAGAYAPGTLRSQPQRSQSMTHSSSQAIRRVAPNRGPARVPKSGSGHNYPTYSLQGSTQPRRASVTSNNSAARVRNGNGSRANSITVKTTEVRDPQGRTQSITRRTIRRVNGYEYVETTTTTTQAIPIVDAEKHFDEFSGNYIIQEDDGAEEPSEGEQPSREPRSGHAYTALTEPKRSSGAALAGGSEGELPLDQTSSLSQFSDALEYIPDQTNRHSRQQRKTVRQGPAAGSRKSPQQASQTRKQQPKRALTEKEMYAKAYAIAQQSVYKTDDSGSGASAPQSRMGQRTLRDSASVDVGSTISSGSSGKPKSKPKRISSFFQRNGKNQNEVTEQSVPQEIEKPQIQAPKSPLPKAPVITAKQKLSDEEMYRQALAIAQEKYGQNQKPVPTNPAPAEPQEQVNEPLQHTSRQEPVKATSSEAVQRSNSNVEEQDSDVFERPEATTATKTTTPEANEGAQINEWERYDMEHPEPEGKKASGERKSKIKNMFEKVKQFSIENSGYQPSKGSTTKAVAVESQAAEEINIIKVAPLGRNQSISSHGASTTRNVEESLETTNRHFDDQASETSFHRSIKKTVAAEPPQQQETAPTEEPTARNETKRTKNNFLKKLFSRS